MITALELDPDHADANLALCHRRGGHVGFTTSPSDWTPWDSAAAPPTAGINAATARDVADPGFAAGRTYGICIAATDTRNACCTAGAGNVAAADAGQTIFEGIGGQCAFSRINSPRVWNGMIAHETTSDVPLPAALPPVGVGALAAGPDARAAAAPRRLSRRLPKGARIG